MDSGFALDIGLVAQYVTGERLWDLSCGQATSGLVIQRFSGDASAGDGTRKDGKEEGFHSSSFGGTFTDDVRTEGGRGA